MKNLLFSRMKITRIIFFGFIVTQFFSLEIYAQKKPAKKRPAAKTAVKTQINLPKVTQIDGAELKKLSQTNGKPLLVNFWATWCDPCREEFPDLVKINADYGEKIDFFTVSLDDAEELNRGVPRFLAQMKAEMPAYLLVAQDEDTVISSVSKDWQGGLPFTILYDADGKAVYSRMGKVKVDVLRAEIEKLVASEPTKISAAKDLSKIKFIDEADLSEIINSRKENSRPLFINFWAIWCKPCIKELPDLMEIKKQFESREIDFLLVSTDGFGSTEKKVALFLQGLNINAPSYLLKVKNKYDMFSLMPFWNSRLPFTVIYDASGNVAFAYTGVAEPQRLKKEIEKILPKNHAEI
ncbi:MAG TPA: TlpA disulfide reductase family protein [Pyrinomonadaceae bacterium]|jgi:thiol-disulfide isomerase/thioredoxin